MSLNSGTIRLNGFGWNNKDKEKVREI